MTLLSKTRRLTKRLLGQNSATLHDARGGRILLVIECILNQNARDRGAASCAAMNRELVSLCLDQNIGLLQIPCPEIRALGWERKRPAGNSLREALDTPEGRASCRKLARDMADRVEQYQAVGYEILGVVGGNEQSPGCAVHHVPAGDPHAPLSQESGLLMQALDETFILRGVDIPIVQLRDADASKLVSDLQWLKQTMTATGEDDKGDSES